ncbi:exosome complex exonuclease [Pyrenophora seminiperda CCB06]|uniref:Exosome complex exonuclease n=1 Tax=Pyrenophora seminiperda CCB06 TaxID=1302712 RepID=A0A3M7LWC6_9PLEO|nr:exosome complex exonuclease [Pyrenophora seminiperda CCB06]
MAQGHSEAPTLHTAVKQDKAEFADCTPCRIVGSATFIGLGAFTYVSGHSQIRANEAAIRASKSIFGVRSRGAAITATSAVMVSLGIYRWFS